MIDSYPSTVNGVAIPDFTCSDTTTGLGGLSNSITIPAGDMGSIVDVNVQVQATHTWRGDIQMSLTDGTTTIPLALDDDGSGDNYHAVFDSAAALLCSDATLCGLSAASPCETAPGPTCQPDSPLDAFNGVEAGNRTFTLNICDDANGDLGTLDNWTLQVERDPPSGTLTGVYPSTINNVALPDFSCTDTTTGLGGVTNTITIPAGDTGTIQDVNVQIQVEHTWRGDIQASISDGTTTVPLALDDDGSGDNYFATFDSAALLQCQDATLCGLSAASPCAAAPGPVCQPEGSLDPFNGAEASNRTFTLSVCDDANGDLGTLLNWTLSVDRLGGGGGTDADLSITKDNGSASSVAGTNTTYTIVASNAGPTDVVGATVADTFPAACSSVNWTCVGAGGGTCAASGMGAISDLVDLPAAASVTYTAICAISPAATGTLDNTATITEPAGITDPDPANNTATDSDTLSASADLAISKTNGVTASTPGTNTVYTIVASNAGPSDAPGSTVADSFPAACTSVNWTCAGAGGGTCTAAGSGNIADGVSLPAGSSVTYSATCAISAAAVGTLDNTATVATGGAVTDPAAGNNTATDSDTLGASADVSVTKATSGVPAPLVLGSTFVYNLVASNAGPSDAANVVVTDALPVNLTHVSNTCGAVFAAPNLTWTIGTLGVGASAACDVTVSVNDYGPINNTANISTSSGDPNAANNAGTTNLAGVPFPADVAVTLTSNAGTNLGVGTQFTYTVTGTNNGPGVANGLLFELSLTNKVSFISSTCGAVINGNVASWTVATLANGASTTCDITVAVVAAGDLLAGVTVTTDSEDLVPANNFAELVVGFIAVAVPTLSSLLLLVLGFLVLGAGVWFNRR